MATSFDELDYGWEELRALWSEIRAGKGAAGFEPGKALEYLVLRAFQLSGADVRWPYDVRRTAR